MPLDSRLAANLDSIRHVVREDDWDFPMLIVGPERSGKTALAAQIGIHYEGYESDPMRLLPHIAWGYDAIEETALRLSPGSILIGNEPGIYGRRASSALNMRALQVFTTIGARNIFFVLTIPANHILDPYLRNHRMRVRGDVYTESGVRGFVRWHVRPKLEYGLDEIVFLETFTNRFESIKGIYQDLWAEIERRDKSFKNLLLAKGKPE